MKLLGWMHRKFRQNNNEPFKDLVIGQPSHDDEPNYHKSNSGIKLFKQTQKGLNLRKSFAGLEAATADDDYEGDSSAAMYDIFPGFLAIGTLGSEQVISHPSTPTFGISVESITEKEDEVTENDLKLINDELEKVLGAETKDDVSTDSSGRNSLVSTGRTSHVSTGRNSHVSTGRNSHVSIITLGGKPTEGTESNGNGTAICPLQGYLFGTAIEVSETTTVSKKEHRISLGELFQRSKEENFSAKCEKEDKRTEREADKSALNLMKEKLKKRMFHACSRSSTSISGGPIDSASAETKLNKILHMFRKKVHPESSTAAQKFAKHRKNENKKKIINDGGHNKGDLVHPKEDSSASREHWIKTDADYLVLEL
ncbi:protein LAZY 1-like [Gastrolobium bilobum]|uniref:protein LAZY 1-like n=1 Tax=Gastrolobium bilobum TaxID=150636 RepID=UPI002AAFD1E0|nr:protein LAZY 1-like [Gastrolobium bilobum]